MRSPSFVFVEKKTEFETEAAEGEGSKSFDEEKVGDAVDAAMAQLFEEEAMTTYQRRLSAVHEEMKLMKKSLSNQRLDVKKINKYKKPGMMKNK